VQVVSCAANVVSTHDIVKNDHFVLLMQHQAITEFLGSSEIANHNLALTLLQQYINYCLIRKLNCNNELYLLI
jgi:hypothetical protein